MTKGINEKETFESALEKLVKKQYSNESEFDQYFPSHKNKQLLSIAMNKQSVPKTKYKTHSLHLM